jgi:antitoxin PrlF
MIIGRITAKSQAIIPRAVRLALGIKPGDEIVYEIVGGEVKLRNAIPVDRDAKDDPFLNNFSAFTEWSGDCDRVNDQP